MKPVLFTDFDRTLIFSKKFSTENGICIDKKEGQPISYMTTEALAILNELKKEVLFIPVSTRTWEGLTRVDFIKDDMPEWLVCYNGGRIYHNGQLLQEWADVIESEKQLFAPVTKLAQRMQEMFRHHGLVEILTHEDCYLMLKFKEMTVEVQAMLESFNFEGYRMEINSRKVYVLPDFIRKERAVQFLMDKLNVAFSISAGDSIMDVEMLRLTDYAVAPKHKSFEEDFMFVTKETGLLAGEEILRSIQSVVQKAETVSGNQLLSKSN